MKIGFVLDDRLDKPDGVQQYITLLGTWLDKQGHEVHYLVGHSPNAKQKNVHHLSKTIGVRFNKNRMAIPLPASHAAIKKLLEKENFDVLHVQMPYSPLLAGKIMNLASANTAVVGTFHILPHGLLSSVGTASLSKIVSKSKKRLDANISVSSTAAEFAKKQFGIESAVLPNVVELDLYKKGKPLKTFCDKQNVVFLGRFVERKGAHLLLKAYGELVALHPELQKSSRLILCGDGPDRQKLEVAADKIRENGAEILFTGFLDEHDKKDYLASATIACFPSTGGESFGIVLIEAMAAGAGVVLGGQNPGYETVLGENPQSLVEAHNTKKFADRLHALLTNGNERAILHAAQQKTVEKYDIAYVGPKIVSFYEQTLAKRNRKKDT